MRRFLLSVVLLAGCGFDYDRLRRAPDGADMPEVDAGGPSGDATTDARKAEDRPIDAPDGPATDGPAMSAPDAASADGAAAADTQTVDVPADMAAAIDIAAPIDVSPDGPTRAQVMYGCPPDDELRACYTFDDPGTTLVDRSRHENHGERNTAAVITGASGTGSALHFSDGKQYAFVRHRPSLNLAGTEATLEAWIRPDRASADDQAADSLATKWTPQYTGYSFATYDNAVRIYTAGNTGRSAGAWTPGVWSHAAVVLSATGVTIYLNGVKAHPDPLPALTIPANTEILTMGNTNPAIQTTSSSYAAFYGAIDVLRIYGRAKSAEEICADAGGTWTAGACKPR